MTDAENNQAPEEKPKDWDGFFESVDAMADEDKEGFLQDRDYQ